MSLPNQMVTRGDNAVSPAAIPGGGRSYSAATYTAISVPGEDAFTLRTMGWVGVQNCDFRGSGTTANRPGSTGAVSPIVYIGDGYVDTTIGAVILYGGPVTGWVNAATGASV
jgi:hypothetical protein